MKKDIRKNSRGIFRPISTSKNSNTCDNVIGTASPYKIPNYLSNPDCPFTKIYPMIGGKFEWMQGDNEKNFKKNKTLAGDNWKYLTKSITYTINSDGYRAPEWKNVDWKNSIVLFGCSCTYGIGVSDEETIAYHLEKLSGRPVINLGVPSGSNSLMIQNAINLLEFYGSPYAVANIWSTTDRFRFFGKETVYHVGPWDVKDNQSPVANLGSITQLWKHSYMDPYHELGLTYYDGKIGKSIWQDRSKYSSISFFPDTAYYTNSEKQFTIDMGARDLIHPGEENFKEIANYLHERFK